MADWLWWLLYAVSFAAFAFVASRAFQLVAVLRPQTGARDLAHLGLSIEEGHSLDGSPAALARLPLPQRPTFTWTFRHDSSPTLVPFPHGFVMAVPGSDSIPEPLRIAGFNVAHDLQDTPVTFAATEAEIVAQAPLTWIRAHGADLHGHMRTLAEATMKSFPPRRSGV